MSWSIEEHIGESRPFPAQVVVYRGETDECLGYVRGDVADRLKAENAKLRELCKRFAEYVSQDRCEGCVFKRRCNDGEIEECWQRTEIRSAAHELGIEVDG